MINVILLDSEVGCMIEKAIAKEYRFFFAIMIFVHHLCLNVSFLNDSLLAPFLRAAGYLSVSVFFSCQDMGYIHNIL